MIKQRLWQFFVPCLCSFAIGGIAYLLTPKPWWLEYQIFMHLLAGTVGGSVVMYMVIGKIMYPSIPRKWDVVVLGVMCLAATSLLTRFILDYWSLYSIGGLSDDSNYVAEVTDAWTNIGLTLGTLVMFLFECIYRIIQILKQGRRNEEIDIRARQPWHR